MGEEMCRGGENKEYIRRERRKDKLIEKQGEKHKCRLAHSRTYGKSDSDRDRDRQTVTGRQTGRQTDRQTGRGAGRRTRARARARAHTHTHTPISYTLIRPQETPHYLVSRFLL